MPIPADRRLTLVYAIILVDVLVGTAIGPVMPDFVRGLRQSQVFLGRGQDDEVADNDEQ